MLGGSSSLNGMVYVRGQHQTMVAAGATTIESGNTNAATIAIVERAAETMRSAAR